MSADEPEDRSGSRPRSRPGPPELLVEQLALGELDETRAAQVRAELEREAAATGRDRLAELAAANREILADYPPERVAADIRRRAAREQERDRGRGSRSHGWVPWVLAPSLVAAAALVWIVVGDPGRQTVAVVDSKGPSAELVDDGELEKTRIKGAVEPHLVIDRQTEAGHERLGAGEGVRAGDLLQVSYVPAGRRAGVILSIDGAGVVTLHHPSDAGAKPTLREGEEVPLAHAYELDDAPGFERFVFVTRAGPDEGGGALGQAEVAAIVAAAERLAADPAQARSAPLPLSGEGWSQHSLLLRKTAGAGEDEGDALDPVPAVNEPRPSEEGGP